MPEAAGAPARGEVAAGRAVRRANVALASGYDTDAILTLDRRDFRAVRPLGRHKAFRVLPDDLPL